MKVGLSVLICDVSFRIHKFIPTTKVCSTASPTITMAEGERALQAMGKGEEALVLLDHAEGFGAEGDATSPPPQILNLIPHNLTPFPKVTPPPK